MVVRYMVGMKVSGKSASVTVDAEDALIAALKVKQENRAAMITYVRKHNVRGDRRRLGIEELGEEPAALGDKEFSGATK